MANDNNKKQWIIIGAICALVLLFTFGSSFIPQTWFLPVMILLVVAGALFVYVV